MSFYNTCPLNNCNLHEPFSKGTFRLLANLLFTEILYDIIGHISLAYALPILICVKCLVKCHQPIFLVLTLSNIEITQLPKRAEMESSSKALLFQTLRL